MIQIQKPVDSLAQTEPHLVNKKTSPKNKIKCAVPVYIQIHNRCCSTFWDPIDCSTPGFPVLHSLLEFAQTHVIEPVMLSNYLILCCPLLLSSSIFPSIRVFSIESVLHMRWPKCWSFSFSISPSNEHSGLISFRMDRLDLLAVQGMLKSLLQHHSTKASILWHSVFSTVQHHIYTWPLGKP